MSDHWVIRRRPLPGSLRYVAGKLDELAEAGGSPELRGYASLLFSLADGTVREASLGEVFGSLNRVLVTSSRDWGDYWADAWLYAVLVGWDCEEIHEHDDVCGGDAAMRETAARHDWDEETVTRSRRYRAAVRAVSDG